MRYISYALAGLVIAVFGVFVVTSTQLLAASPVQRQRSPLAEYPGFGANPTADEAQYNREELARRHFVAKCMREQGLSYTPVPARQVTNATTPEQDYAASQDPNIVRADALDLVQRQTYYKALYGVADPYDESSPVGGGCFGEASRMIPGVYAAQSKLNEQLIELEQSIRSDPRVISAEQNWSVCMKGYGHSYANTRSLLGEIDRAADVGQVTTELEQRHAQAIEIAKFCDSEVGLVARQGSIEG